MCKYSYRDESNSRQQIYCHLTKNLCIYSRYCTKVGKFVEADGMENCFMAKEEERKNIPDGAYKVAFEHRGFLYVELEDGNLTKIKNTIGQSTSYVYAKKVNGEYKISLIPFTNTKSTTKRKTKTEKNA